MRFEVQDGELVITEEKDPPCKFCMEYEESVSKTIRPNLNPHFKVCMYEYYTRDRKKISRHIHKPHKLNYCPECGKKLKGVPR